MDSSAASPSQPTLAARAPAPRPVAQMVIGCLVIPLMVAALGVGGFLYWRSSATDQLTVPDQEIVLVRAAPEPQAALLARFGEGETLQISGRTEDWQWLEVTLWDGRRGWALRPLDILVWQIEAAPATPVPLESLAAPVVPVPEAMIALPETSFTMGSPPGLGEEDERPAHPVSLSGFEIDRTEVSVGQYWDCVAAGGCAPPAQVKQSGLYYLQDPAFDNYPVVNVPWLQASRYCNWRGKRLPTEAEWEMAAAWDPERGAKLLWPWGNQEVERGVNTGPASAGRSGPVGSFEADRSPAGVLDMGGNVSEWVADWYKVDYYSLAEAVDPAGPAQRRGEGTGKVVRGGSFADGLAEARSANRRHLAEKSGYSTVGFRCARDRN